MRIGPKYVFFTYNGCWRVSSYLAGCGTAKISRGRWGTLHTRQGQVYDIFQVLKPSLNDVPFIGLDFVLLEANEARARDLQEEEADAALDGALVGAASSSTKTKTDDVTSPSTVVPKKRTREEAIAQLKRMRAEKQSESLPAERSTLSDIEALERVKKVGKFRPIGAPLPEPSKSSSKATEQGEK
jgi:hypothetical protein